MQFMRRIKPSSLYPLLQSGSAREGNRCLHAGPIQSSIRYSGIPKADPQSLFTSLQSSLQRSFATLEQAQGQVAGSPHSGVRCSFIAQTCASYSTSHCIQHASSVHCSICSQIDELNDKFVEARDEIEYAQEDAETTYFNESHKLAKDSVGVVTSMYKDILETLSEADKGKLQRSMGMKMEQLKVWRLHL